jgi:hypothetical protein
LQEIVAPRGALTWRLRMLMMKGARFAAPWRSSRRATRQRLAI